MTLRLAALAAPLLLIATATLAAAEDPGRSQIGVKVEFIVQDDRQLNNGRLPPESATLKYTVRATLTYPPASACETLVTVRFTVLPLPAYVVGILSQSSASKVVQFKSGVVETGPVGATGGTDTIDTGLLISARRDAPALEDLKVAVQAEAQPGSTNTCNMSPGRDTGTMIFKPDYLPIMQYTPTTQIVKVGQNKGVNFGLRMTNLGNGPTKVDIRVENPGGNKLESFLAPGSQKLESKAQGAAAQTEKEILLQVRTPSDNGYKNSFYSLVATFDASYDGNLLNGARDIQSLPLSIQVQGVYVPGFDPALLVAALGLVTLVLGRARGRS